MYNYEEELIHYISQKFNNQKRKKEEIPLVFHSYMVAIMLKNIHASKRALTLGYLHDLIEDTNTTYEELASLYGSDIADSVLKLSENQKISDYHQRKNEFINRLKDFDPDLLLVELADKLQNLLSDYQLFINNGPSSLVTEANTYEETKWYYLTLQQEFNRLIPNNELLKRYNEIVSLYFTN